jgi:Predicted transcriptional regulators
MRTVKQVSDLTGISVRALHYYDEIGLLKPSEITETGYRLYNDEALKTLQQILFFKELDMPLKEVKDIMTSPYFDKMEALKNQKKLLVLKRKRLNGLIELINKTLKGEGTMNFKEFDMSEYYDVLEEYKTEHEDKVIQNYGSIEKYNEFIKKCKAKEDEIAKSAIKQYGSIEKYAKAVKHNLTNSASLSLAEEIDMFKKDCLEDKHPKLKELFKKLTADLSKDTASKEIQEIAEELVDTVKKDYEVFKTDRGDDYWYYMTNLYSVYPEWIEAVDKKYGSGGSKI